MRSLLCACLAAVGLPAQARMLDEGLRLERRDLGHLAAPRLDHGVLALRDHRVLAVGGAVRDFAAAALVASAELIDVERAMITPAGSLAAGRRRVALCQLADGSVLAIGGVDHDGAVARVECYDLAAGTWTVVAPMRTARAAAACAVLADGRVFVAGGVGGSGALGRGGDGVVLASCELYDPRADRWTPGAPLHVARAAAASVRIGDGQVLVAGGITAPASVVTHGHSRGTAMVEHATPTVERYDVTADAWVTLPPLTTGHAPIAAARLLAPDLVLVESCPWRALEAEEARVECLDLTAGSWRRPALEAMREGPAHAAPKPGLELVSPFGSFLLRDPNSDRWCEWFGDVRAGVLGDDYYRFPGRETAVRIDGRTVLWAGGEWSGQAVDGVQRFRLLP